MIFKDKIISFDKLYSKEFDRLFKIALNSQNHPSDLLLLNVNGFYDKKILDWNKNYSKKLNPHLVGPNIEGFSEKTHYSFIHKYRTTNIIQTPFAQFLEDVKYDTKKQKEIEELIEIEETTIQLEMLIYLKFWEADMIIKKLYQFARILNGEPYDWYFKIAESTRDKNNTGTRQDIIRLKIRNKIENNSTDVYNLIKNTYKTQIRNSIAHSNYSMIGRSINLNNYIKDDPHSQINSISFDDWIEIFHNTLTLHNQYIKLNNRINDFYGEIALKNNNIVPILITEKDGKQYELPLEYRKEYKDWGYKQN